jgi:hypothetical protein
LSPGDNTRDKLWRGLAVARKERQRAEAEGPREQ